MLGLSILPKHASEAAGDYAYRVLHHNITHVALKPGVCISPIEVASALHISRTPVQGAFARLASEGLLNIYPQRGSYVSMIDLKRVHESIYMRNILDQSAIRVLCEKGIESHGLTELENNIHLQQFYHTKDMYPEIFDTDNKFHQAIYMLSGMSNIFRSLQTIIQDQQRVRYLKLYNRMRWEETIDEHTNILNAIRSGDSEKACYLSFLHVSRFGVDIPAVNKAYPDYFTNWDSFEAESFSAKTDAFYNLQKL